jgi:hypothetical protein
MKKSEMSISLIDMNDYVNTFKINGVQFKLDSSDCLMWTADEDFSEAYLQKVRDNIRDFMKEN